jgi:hypothetical protein
MKPNFRIFTSIIVGIKNENIELHIGFNHGYLKFVDWAKSAGVQCPDWYLDLPG